MDLQQALILIIIALTLYTVGFWQSRKYNYQSAVIFFLLGFGFDFVGTWTMYQVTGKITWGFHSILGMLALFLMFMVVILGFIALFKLSNKLADWFRRLVPYAYGVWVLSFITGAISH
jgi:uncharacterized repeat protein (TIGR03987 family)